MFVTFYSYKGGVGRSLALTNTAYALAREGRSVFVVDFDLEAPGLDCIALKGNAPAHVGLVEYIARYKSTKTPPALKEFTIDITTPSLPGSVVLMPAGKKDTNYQIELNKIDWKDFYRRDDGFFFIENLKGQISSEFCPDYVLIDSRTGLTDIGGICTLHLPDLVVLVFNLNEQNLMGIQQVQKTIQFNHLNKDIKTLPVVSPVPDMSISDSPLAARLHRAKELLGVPDIDLLIHYNASMALEEKIMVLEDRESPLSMQYHKIASRIVSLNPEDFKNTLEDARQDFKNGEWVHATNKFHDVTARNPHNFVVQLEAASYFRAIKRYKDSLSCALRAKDIHPEFPDAYIELSKIYLKLKKKREAIRILNQIRPNMARSSGKFDPIPIIRMYDDLGQKQLSAFWLSDTISWINSGPGARSSDVATTLAEYLMSMKKYKAAAGIYGPMVKENPRSMADIYNLAYAMHKAKMPGSGSYFGSAIALFEIAKIPQSPHHAANLYQAIHFAYRHTGNPLKAAECLKQAEDYALKSSSERSSQPIFSAAQYKYIPASKFVIECHILIRGVLRNIRHNSKVIAKVS